MKFTDVKILKYLVFYFFIKSSLVFYFFCDVLLINCNIKKKSKYFDMDDWKQYHYSMCHINLMFEYTRINVIISNIFQLFQIPRKETKMSVCKCNKVLLPNGGIR